MTGAGERLLIRREQVAAPQVRAMAVVCLELVAVFRIQPHTQQRAALDPRVVLCLHEIDTDWNANIECSRVIGDLDPAVGLRLGERRRNESPDDGNADESCENCTANAADDAHESAPLYRMRR